MRGMVVEKQQQATTNAWPVTFVTTQWSVVAAAGDKDSPQSDQALEALCRAYWYPLYVFVRRRVTALKMPRVWSRSFLPVYCGKTICSGSNRSEAAFARRFVLLRHCVVTSARKVQFLSLGQALRVTFYALFRGKRFFASRKSADLYYGQR
jgi:hypothetical protein